MDNFIDVCLEVDWNFQVNQQKAKLIDMEANVTLQERSTGKVDRSHALLLNLTDIYF